MIPGYQKGSDITLLDLIYHRPQKLENGKYSNDVMTVIFRDNQLKEKRHVDIENPTFEFEMLNDDEQIQDYPQMFIPKEKVHTVSVPYKELDKKIAELTGNEQFFYDNLKSGNFTANSMLHSNLKLFSSDENLEDNFRRRFAAFYTNEPYILEKGFLDIETDIINMPHTDNIGNHYGDYPINAVTFISDGKNQVSTFVLRDKKNPLIQEFENWCNTGMFQQEIKDFVRDKVGGWKQEIRFGLDKYQYRIFFYDDELELIYDLFKVINHDKPDFVLAWNMAFDIPYIMERIKYFGLNPEDIICDPSFKNKKVQYYIDERHQNVHEEKGDFAKISGYTVYVDQLIQYASRRKGQSKPPNFRLDTIGNIVAKVRKYDYSHITTDIAELPYKNFKVFIFYNIMDTIVQKCIEKRTEDINFLFYKTLINNTRYNKSHRNTIYLANRAREEFLKNEGVVLGNNHAYFKQEEKKGKFLGAIVSSPQRVDKDSLIKNKYGIQYNIFRNGVDFDFSSMYPNITAQFNIIATALIARINIPEQIQAVENPLGMDFYVREGQYIEDLSCKNYIDFCERWLNLAGFSDLLDDVREYIDNYSNSGTIVSWNNNTINPFRIKNKGVLTNPMQFNDFKTNPMIIRNVFDQNKYKEYVEGKKLI